MDVREWDMSGLSSETAVDTVPTRQQCADAVLMIRPAAFGFNAETAASNTFQMPAPAGLDGAATARTEFDGLRRALESEGVRVVAVEDTHLPVKPDAVFPNNWVSFHPCGTLVLYPMANPSRRLERRQDAIEAVVARTGFRVSHLLDLTHFESQGKHLEGTGSLVLDHVNRVAYACTSARTHPDVVREWARELGFEPVIFVATNRAGVPLYHTNVLMCIGARAVIVAADAIAPADRERVLAKLRASGREIIDVGHAGLEQFVGNMLELASWDEALGDCRVLVMSESARKSLSREAFAQLSGSTDAVLAVPVPTIERLGGGSVRCMMAEVFAA
jgi:hypothetical protein